jgi:hypothetical protein
MAAPASWRETATSVALCGSCRDRHLPFRQGGALRRALCCGAWLPSGIDPWTKRCAHLACPSQTQTSRIVAATLAASALTAPAGAASPPPPPSPRAGVLAPSAGRRAPKRTSRGRSSPSSPAAWSGGADAPRRSRPPSRPSPEEPLRKEDVTRPRRHCPTKRSSRQSPSASRKSCGRRPEGGKIGCGCPATTAAGPCGECERHRERTAIRAPAPR